MKKSFIALFIIVALGAACSRTTVSVRENQNDQSIPSNVNQSQQTTTVSANTNVTLNTNSATTTTNVNAAQSQQRLDDTNSTVLSPVRVPTADGDHYFLVGQPQGQNSTTVKKIIFSLPGHGSTAEQDYEAWKPQLASHDYALASVNWWDGSGEAPTDYYSPLEVWTNVKQFLATYGYTSKDFVVLHGFSRGSANTYAVKSYDTTSSVPIFDAVISASGKYQADFPLAPGVVTAVDKIYLNVPWILACGEKDDNPERDGCLGMNETKTFLTSEGARVLGVLSDPNGTHGAFHQSPLKLADQALTLLDTVVGASSP